ncbi:hypothetical protein BOVA115_1759 [Bacteroides ovatus]|nr:hypothetical protein BOVA115_1759 [Bacteroides ovatus]
MTTYQTYLQKNTSFLNTSYNISLHVTPLNQKAKQLPSHIS